MRDPIAYLYDADTHCEYCAKEDDRFEPNEGNYYLVGYDNEGNEITPVHAFETTLNEDHDFADGPNISGCSDCGRIIEAQTNEGGMVDLYPFYTVSDYFKHWHEVMLEKAENKLDDVKHELKQLRNDAHTLIVMIEDQQRGICTSHEVSDFAKIVKNENDLETADDPTDDS